VRRAPSWDDVLVQDLSSGGAGVHSPSHLDVGTEVTLEFTLPAEEGRGTVRVEVLCLVVRTGRPAQSNPRRPHLCGLHFLILDPGQVDRIREYVWNHLPKESD